MTKVTRNMRLQAELNSIFVFKKSEMTPKFHPLVVQDIRKETDDTVSIAFEIPSELTIDYLFVSGQYITIRKIINGEELRRSYSICTTPHDGELRVAVKRVDDGVFSSWATSELKTGDVLDVMTPSGHFQLVPEIAVCIS